MLSPCRRLIPALLSQDGVVVRGEDAIPVAPQQKKGRCATIGNPTLDKLGSEECRFDL